MFSLLGDLNAEQQEAITHREGPLLIVAGAGTGKTTVITRRLAWLIDTKRASPDEILALTFTEKAAQEMEERVDRLLPYGYVDLWVSTFHSFGERVLRDWALEIGLDPAFKVLSRAQAWLLLRKHLDELNLKYYRPLGNPTRFIQALVQHFSRLKDEHISTAEYLRYAEHRIMNQALRITEAGEESNSFDARHSKFVIRDSGSDEAERTLEVARAYARYEELLLQDGYVDFGDLIIRTLELFQKRSLVLEKFRSQFTYLLIDEFQDTNHSQYELVKLLADPKNNLTVVGDDDQSVFRFRGASMSNILEFKKNFPNAKEILLTKNYRSKQNILDLAYQFIRLNNPNRLEVRLAEDRQGALRLKPVSKKLEAYISGEGIITSIESETQEDEVLDVLREILRLKQEDPSLLWSDFAILVRANDQADLFTKTFTNQAIPYQFVSARGLYQQPEILDMIAWLKMLDNYHESPALFRVLSMDMIGIDSRDLVHLLTFSRRKSISLFEALERHGEIPGLRVQGVQKVRWILELIRRGTELSKTKSAGKVLFEFLKEIGYLEKMTGKESDRWYVEIQNISKFFRQIQEFERIHEDHSVQNFVREIFLMTDLGEGPSTSELEEGPDTVRIMTVHGAKGLEFRYVFIVQLVDKRFPSIERREPIEVPAELLKEIIQGGDIHLEEERRLFYVACTRAKDGLYFTAARDYGGKSKKKPSRFLYEIRIKKEKPRIQEKQLHFGFDIVEKKQEKTTVVYSLPEKFSYTQLKAYETCPKQYKYAHIWKIPVLAGRHTYSFGTSLHNTLKEFFIKIQEGKVPSKEELFEIYEKNWIEDWYESKRHEQERKEQGKEMLESFYEQYHERFSIPLYLEKGFNFKIGEYTIKGLMDRVDRLPDGSIEIIDYKTGKKPSSKSEIDHSQLLIYAMAAKEVFQENPTRLSYYYLEDTSVYSFPPSEEAIARLQTNIEETIGNIGRGDFAATPSSYKCASCDFRDICEDRAR